jgi:hypothetical protein
LIIHPYKIGSRSAKRLKEAMNAAAGSKVVHILQRQPKSRRSLIINWGASEIAYPEEQHWIINHPAFVKIMSDKILFFKEIGDTDDVLVWTTSTLQAEAWLATGSKVFARELTRASGGRGIHVLEPGTPASSIPKVPLYTRHQPKTHEYRLHMARSLNGCEFEPILIQRKVWKNVGEQPKTWDVRSHDNGFIFQSYPDQTKIPERVLEVSRQVMAKNFSDMHFAALDILYHKPTDRAVVCEGNTAPGLENNTVDIYAKYFSELAEDFQKEKMVYL